MLTKKTDNYKNLELSRDLKEAGLEIDIDGITEDIEEFLRKDPREEETSSDNKDQNEEDNNEEK